MQINKDTSFEGLKAYTREAREAQRTGRADGKAAGPAAAGEDQVVVTQQNSLVQRALESESLERQERIEKLREQFAAGAYEVDAKSVARALVSEAIGPAEDPGGDT